MKKLQIVCKRCLVKPHFQENDFSLKLYVSLKNQFCCFYSKIKKKYAINRDNRINIFQIFIFACGQSVLNNKYIQTETQIFFKLLFNVKIFL